MDNPLNVSLHSLEWDALKMNDTLMRAAWWSALKNNDNMGNEGPQSCDSVGFLFVQFNFKDIMAFASFILLLLTFIFINLE